MPSTNPFQSLVEAALQRPIKLEVPEDVKDMPVEFF